MNGAIWSIREKLKNVIRAKLGLSKKIFARTLKVADITTKQEKEFLRTYHLQNWHPSIIRKALIDDNGNIQMLMSIGKSRFKSKHDFEIIRMCSNADTTVVGGLSKLLNAVRKQIGKDKSIISYCDQRFGNGRGYAKCGMMLIGESKPNYVWWKHKTFLKRWQTMKHRLPELLGANYRDDMSEKENMVNNGWKQLSDAGNLKFVITSG